MEGRCRIFWKRLWASSAAARWGESSSTGRASYESEENSGIGSNGLTLARHALLAHSYAERFPESFSETIPAAKVYCGRFQLKDTLPGSSQRVAEIGALGRFAVIFALITSVTNGIVLPRFARCQDRGILRRRYWQTIGGCTCIFGLLVAASAFFPRPLLWILGSQYANLEHEVWLMMLNAAMGAMFMTMYGLTFSKAWIPSALVTIPMEILTQAILIFTLDISTVRGVLVLGCLSCVPPILLNIYIARRELGKTEAAHAENPPSSQT